MKQKKPLKLTNFELVKTILEAFPEARGNDNELIYLCLVSENKSTDYEDMRHSSNNVCETYRRCRQKVQELYPELRPAETVKRHRAKRDDEFSEFARGRTREI